MVEKRVAVEQGDRPSARPPVLSSLILLSLATRICALGVPVETSGCSSGSSSGRKERKIEIGTAVTNEGGQLEFVESVLTGIS